MNERTLNLLEKYPLKIVQVYRGRGAFVLETDQGLKLLRPYAGTEKKAALQQELLTFLKQEGSCRIDSYLQNKEGEFLTKDWEGTNYLVKDWYRGRECDTKKKEEIYLALTWLAKLHSIMSSFSQESFFTEITTAPNLLETIEKHQKELKKIKNYIQKHGKKTAFEYLYSNVYEEFYEQGEQAKEAIGAIPSFQRGLCHGDFHQHNILFFDGEAAITNFEHCHVDSPVKDLYQFLRKMLEKHHWDTSLGMAMLRAYESVRPLTALEQEELYERFLYPEKFWKVANHYYNSNKVWVSEKNLEKLQTFQKQNEERSQFLELLKNKKK